MGCFWAGAGWRYVSAACLARALHPLLTPSPMLSHYLIAGHFIHLLPCRHSDWGLTEDLDIKKERV